jgi:bifunctional ADP-heptose synthase (sugar kinase/adenylyltransferase)
MLQFSGITAATPNEAEVEEILGIRVGNDWNRLVAAGEQIVGEMKLESLLITRGKDGLVAFPRRHRAIDIPICGSDEVADVTGAGDTVIATFTAALAAGADTEEAAHLANYAGGIVVMKRGTATVSHQVAGARSDGARNSTALSTSAHQGFPARSTQERVAEWRRDGVRVTLITDASSAAYWTCKLPARRPWLGGAREWPSTLRFCARTQAPGVPDAG